MGNEDPLDENDCFEEQDENQSEAQNSDTPDDVEGSIEFLAQPRIEGWVSSTLSEKISSYSDDELRMLLREILQSKKRFREIE